MQQQGCVGQGAGHGPTAADPVSWPAAPASPSPAHFSHLHHIVLQMLPLDSRTFSAASICICLYMAMLWQYGSLCAPVLFTYVCLYMHAAGQQQHCLLCSACTERHTPHYSLCHRRLQAMHAKLSKHLHSTALNNCTQSHCKSFQY